MLPRLVVRDPQSSPDLVRVGPLLVRRAIVMTDRTNRADFHSAIFGTNLVNAAGMTIDRHDLRGRLHHGLSEAGMAIDPAIERRNASSAVSGDALVLRDHLVLPTLATVATAV